MRFPTGLLTVFFPLLLEAQPQAPKGEWLTRYEKSGCTATPRYEETVAFCRRMEKASPWIKLIPFGRTPQGREMMLVVASREKAFDPVSAARTGKAVLLVQNGIHAGEIDGKDACLMLLRDIAVTKTRANLLDRVILLVIPVYNVDGHERFSRFNRINQNGPREMGWRVTAQNLNLNRDYMKAEAPETRAWLRMFTSWLPDFFIDCHVTDGADFQFAVTYGMESHDWVAAPVRSWIREKFLPMLDTLKAAGAPVFPYVGFRNDLDPSKGLGGGTAPPRLSHTYGPMQNRPTLLIESHMLKDYKTRVTGTYSVIAAALSLVNREYASVRAAVRSADAETSRGLERPFPLRYDDVDTPSDTLTYLGYRQRNEPSDISGTTRIIYTREPFTMNIPRYDSVRVAKSVDPPRAYLIPQEWQEIISRLKLHGIQIERLRKRVELEVESYRFTNLSWPRVPYEGRHSPSYGVQKITSRRTYPAGTAVVHLNQRAARVAVHLLEPEGPDSFAAWGFFDAVCEQKEFAENYVMEDSARSMLARDPALKVEFDSKLRTDTSFARNPFARLNFFYQHSPYWDEKVNLYPVDRLMESVALPTYQEGGPGHQRSRKGGNP